jgi:hypothetical protein
MTGGSGTAVVAITMGCTVMTTGWPSGVSGTNTDSGEGGMGVGVAV